MPRFDVWNHLIKPIGEQLQRDRRFGELRVFYDRAGDNVPRELMPCIQYFLEAPMSDIARGSSVVSLQRRQVTINLSFVVWIYETDNAKLDEALFQVFGDLNDFFWEKRNFDPTHGVTLQGDISGDVDFQGDENGIVGTHKWNTEFIFYA